MPIKLSDVLRRLPHVSVVSPANLQLNTSGVVETIMGIDYPSYNALKPFTFVEGGPPQGPYDMMIDDVFARSKKGGYHVGDKLEVYNREFRISGIVEAGRGGRKLLPLDTMGDLTGSPDKASTFYIKVDDPANERVVIDEIHNVRGLADYPVGILKSLGSPKPLIVSVVLRETAAIAVAGVVLGILGTYLVRTVLLHVFPTQHFEITAHWLMQGAVIAFIGSILGAMYPAWMAARKDPIDALAYE